MSKKLWIIPILTFSLGLQPVQAARVIDTLLDGEKIAFEIGTDSQSLKIKSIKIGEISCSINNLLADNKKISSLKTNTEKTALILTSMEFISINSLSTCNGGTVEAQRIPDKVGFLVDVNLKNSIYIALDTVSVQPFGYAATVARLGSAKLLIDLPGAYSPRKSLKVLQKYAFSYNDELQEGQPKIATNGRYVAVSGEVDCSTNAVIGVWDLQTKKRVVFKSTSDQEDLDKKCGMLFDSP